MNLFQLFLQKCVGQIQHTATSSTLVIVKEASRRFALDDDESYPISIESNKKNEESFQQILELLDLRDSGSDDEFSSTEEHNQIIRKTQKRKKVKKLRKKDKSKSPEELLFSMDDF